jgi:hypothetical protein
VIEIFSAMAMMVIAASYVGVLIRIQKHEQLITSVVEINSSLTKQVLSLTKDFQEVCRRSAELCNIVSRVIDDKREFESAVSRKLAELQKSVEENAIKFN